MISEFPLLRLGAFIGLLVLMFLIEGRWPARSWTESRASRAWFSAKLALLNNVFFRVVVATPFVAFTYFVSEQGWGIFPLLKPYLPADDQLRTVFEIGATIVVFDFFDYLKHRWFHRVGFMWRAHRVHHTDTHLDVFTALRYHPGELLISALIKAIWLVVWGPSALAFTVFEIVLNVASQYHHSNIDFPERLESILSRVIVTPRYHAMHHTIHRDKGDYNFSTIFSFWDALGGSQKRPAPSDIDLERLGVLQERHLVLQEVLKSPLLPDAPSVERAHAAWAGLVHGDPGGEKGRVVLLDVREGNEIEESGHAEGTVWLPFSALQSDSELVRALVRAAGSRSTFVVYCAAGLRSEKAVQLIRRAGGTALNAGGCADLQAEGVHWERGVPAPFTLDAQHIQASSMT